MILAQLGAGYSIVQMVIMLIIIIAVVGILFVVMRQSGVAIPAWAINIAWIVLVAVVAIFAIKFLMSMV